MLSLTPSPCPAPLPAVLRHPGRDVLPHPHALPRLLPLQVVPGCHQPAAAEERAPHPVRPAGLLPAGERPVVGMGGGGWGLGAGGRGGGGSWAAHSPAWKSSGDRIAGTSHQTLCVCVCPSVLPQTPVGDLLVSFTKDQDTLDEALPDALYYAGGLPGGEVVTRVSSTHCPVPGMAAHPSPATTQCAPPPPSSIPCRHLRPHPVRHHHHRVGHHPPVLRAGGRPVLRVGPHAHHLPARCHAPEEAAHGHCRWGGCGGQGWRWARGVVA